MSQPFVLLKDSRSWTIDPFTNAAPCRCFTLCKCGEVSLRRGSSAGYVLKCESHLAGQEIPHFMELEGSLPSSQQTATGPHPEPHASSHHILTLFP